MLRHPELYGAVVCGNPLLEMKRYHKLLAGASWVAEYGSADVPAEWAFLSKYSPYQNLRAGQKLPPVPFYTSPPRTDSPPTQLASKADLSTR